MTAKLLGPEHLVNAVANLMRVFFPQRERAELEIELVEEHVAQQVKLTCKVGGLQVSELGEPHLGEIKRLSRVVFVKAMQELYPEVKLPWGILTGVRPTKIVHRLLDQGYTQGEIANYLAEQYLVQKEKIALVQEVASLQRPYLLTPQQAARLVSVYIGVPFCPSRCVYCSFPSSVGDNLQLAKYLSVLAQEISAVGAVLKDLGLGVQSLYIGGGTPTIFSEQQLAHVLELCHAHLITGQTREFTLEAGRPDTLDQGKLSLFKTMGVSRLSINPQSMVAETLQRIGRRHTPEQLIQAYELARQLGFDNINMDIILGLPGEGVKEVAHTLKQLGHLQPESVTVHALAIKRASLLKEELGGQVLHHREAEAMQELAANWAREQGLRPYYLYRQKQMLGNLENVGYAKAEKESIYNIQIMEERQTIFALGAGAASKIVNPGNWSLLNIPNPKQPEVYYQSWQERLGEKVQALTQFKL